MNRSLKLSMLLLAALGSGQLMALELGQIQVKSALGQPLLAEIKVTPEGPGDLRNLRAQMASSEDIARAGITDGRTDVPLRFTIVNGPGSTKLIRITSAQAINNPFLDLLVEVDNARGKSVREFTILLDPPGRRSDSAALIAARSSGPAQSRRSSQSDARPAPASPARTPSAATTGDAKGPYSVHNGDTLSGIARQVSSPGVELNQMLLALKQTNPDAFYRDNVNALKSGAILRVPTAGQARMTSAAAALAEVRRQNGDWRAQTPGAPTRVAAAAAGAGSDAGSSAASDSGDHLALVPSKTAGKQAAGADSGGKGGGSSDATQNLQRSQENVASLQQQGGELKSRVADLQDINSKNQRLLALKNSEIADLQQQLAQARKAAGMPPLAEATPAPAGTTGTSADPVAASSAAAVPQAASSVAVAGSAALPMAAASAGIVASASSAPVGALASNAGNPAAAASSAAPTPAAAEQPAPAPVRMEKPWYMQMWTWIAGGVVILLLLLLGVRGRRRAPAKLPAGESLADRFDNKPAAVAHENGGDLMDADQDELLDHLAEHPDDIGLHLELVSLYYHRRDVERFESAAEAMYAHVSDPEQSEWQDVVAMGVDLDPSHPLFGGSTDAMADEELDEIDERAALDDFDLDAYANTAPEELDQLDDIEGLNGDYASSRGKVSEYHFDFNLTDPDRDQRPSPLADPDTVAEPSAGDAHLDPLPVDESTRLDERAGEADSNWTFDLPPGESMAPHDEQTAESSSDASRGGRFEPVGDPADLGEFSDDPVDTKLDLARAYLDMGDSDGARAMLDEVVVEGSQAQRDSARELRAKLS